MTNKHDAKKFNLSPSNIHRIIIGRRYAGGHKSTKMSRPEEHGEKYVKVTKKSAGSKTSKTSSTKFLLKYTHTTESSAVVLESRLEQDPLPSGEASHAHPLKKVVFC